MINLKRAGLWVVNRLSVASDEGPALLPAEDLQSRPNNGLGFLASFGLLSLLLFLPVFSYKAATASVDADFARYYHAGTVALKQGDLYLAGGDLQFKYLPFFAQCMQPVALFSQSTAAYLWYGVLATSYLVMMAVALFLARSAPSRFGLLLFCGLLFSLRFFTDNARLGQINIPVAALAFAGMAAVIAGWNRRGGLLLAAGAAIKFMPVLLILFCFWKRRWMAGLYGVLGVFLFVFVIPALQWGWTGNLTMLSGYIQLRSKMITSVPAEDAPGQSISGVANRLLRSVRANPWRDKEEIRVNIVDLPISLVNRICLVLILATSALVLFLTRRPWTESSSRVPGLEVSLFFILMLLISPEARRAHFITLLLPAVMASTGLFSLAGRIRKGFLVGLGAAGFCLFGTSSGLIGRSASGLLNAYGVVGIGAGILAGLSIYLLATPQARTGDGGSSLCLTDRREE